MHRAIGPHQIYKSSVSLEGWLWGMRILFFSHRLNRCKMATREQVVLVFAAVTSSVLLSLFIRQNNRRRSGCLSALSHRQLQHPRIQPNHRPCLVQAFGDIKLNCGMAFLICGGAYPLSPDHSFNSVSDVLLIYFHYLLCTGFCCVEVALWGLYWQCYVTPIFSLHLHQTEATTIGLLVQFFLFCFYHETASNCNLSNREYLKWMEVALLTEV